VPLKTVGQDFGVEQPLLRQLPAEPFEPGRLLTPKVDRFGLVAWLSCGSQCESDYYPPDLVRLVSRIRWILAVLAIRPAGARHRR